MPWAGRLLWLAGVDDATSAAGRGRARAPRSVPAAPPPTTMQSQFVSIPRALHRHGRVASSFAMQANEPRRRSRPAAPARAAHRAWADARGRRDARAPRRLDAQPPGVRQAPSRARPPPRRWPRRSACAPTSSWRRAPRRTRASAADPRTFDGLTMWPLTHRGPAGGLHAYKIRISAERRIPPADLGVHEGHDWIYVLAGPDVAASRRPGLHRRAGRDRRVQHPDAALVRRGRGTCRAHRDPRPARRADAPARPLIASGSSRGRSLENPDAGAAWQGRRTEGVAPPHRWSEDDVRR